MARLIVSVLNNNGSSYPVYDPWKKRYRKLPKPIGSVKLQGVNFDLETQAGGSPVAFTKKQCRAVGSLVTSLKNLLPDIKITLTTRAAAADPPGSPPPPGVTGSTTAGELLPLFTDREVMSKVDQVYVMAYDSGSIQYAKSGYRESMKNYAKVLQQNKISLGLSGCKQQNNIKEDLSQLFDKGNWALQSSYGGIMFWCVGVDLVAATGETNSGPTYVHKLSSCSGKRKSIPIKIVVDGESLKNAVEYNSHFQGSTPDKPVNLGSWGGSDKYIYMMTKNSFVVNKQARSELNVKANPNNSIEWTISTFSTDYTAFVYASSFNPSNVIQYDGGVKVQVNTYLPTVDPHSTGDRTKFKNKVYVATAFAKSSGQIQYTFSFCLVDNGTDNPIGWFCWDPFINVRM